MGWFWFSALCLCLLLSLMKAQSWPSTHLLTFGHTHITFYKPMPKCLLLDLISSVLWPNPHWDPVFQPTPPSPPIKTKRPLLLPPSSWYNKHWPAETTHLLCSSEGKFPWADLHCSLDECLEEKPACTYTESEETNEPLHLSFYFGKWETWRLIRRPGLDT